MSLCGYFAKGRESRMSWGRSGDLCRGVRVEGEVLSGAQSVEQRRAEEAVRAPGRVEEKYYGSLEEYDPVLRAHCGF